MWLDHGVQAGENDSIQINEAEVLSRSERGNKRQELCLKDAWEFSKVREVMGTDLVSCGHSKDTGMAV